MATTPAPLPVALLTSELLRRAWTQTDFPRQPQDPRAARQVRAHYRRNLADPGDCRGDGPLLLALALAQAVTGNGVGWRPVVQQMACEWAPRLAPLVTERTGALRVSLLTYDTLPDGDGGRSVNDVRTDNRWELAAGGYWAQGILDHDWKATRRFLRAQGCRIPRGASTDRGGDFGDRIEIIDSHGNPLGAVAWERMGTEGAAS